MPETTRGYPYPASTGHTRLWEYWQDLADAVDADVDTVSDEIAARTTGVVKAVAETVTSSATLQDDDELFVALGVGLWRVEAILLVNSGGATGDFKCAWSFSGTSTGSNGRAELGPPPTTTDVSDTNMRAFSSSASTTVNYGVDGSLSSVIREDLVYNVTAAGTLILQWAQGTSSGTATNLLAGSRLYVTKLN